MALNPEVRYAGQITAASPGYPYGKARNILVPGDNLGTPYEEDSRNDDMGFQQALLSRAGIVPTNNPDEVGASQYLDAIDFIVLASVKAIYPVGGLYSSTLATNPAALLGFGTWVAFGEGRVQVGLDSGDTDFDTSEEEGGSKTHTLTTPEIPAHTHLIEEGNETGGVGAQTMTSGDGFTDDVAKLNASRSTGGGGPHNNVQPYIVVYMWKRTV